MIPLPHDYTTLIRAHGFRVTPQRQFILDAIRAGDGHSTPEEIYQRVNEKATTINRATVYRNLDFLCEMRLVVAVQIGGQMYYEFAGTEPHHHLICRKCNRVEQIGHQTVKELFDKIDREQSFLIDMDHLALFGVCKQCREIETKTPL